MRYFNLLMASLEKMSGVGETALNQVTESGIVLITKNTNWSNQFQAGAAAVPKVIREAAFMGMIAGFAATAFLAWGPAQADSCDPTEEPIAR